MAGTFRIYLKNGVWKRYHIIFTKVTIVASSLAYIVMAADLMLNDQFTGAFKDFIFLYAFGLATFFAEIYSKISDIDGTGDFRYDYIVLK